MIILQLSRFYISFFYFFLLFFFNVKILIESSQNHRSHIRLLRPFSRQVLQNSRNLHNLGLHSPCGQPVPVPDCPQSEKVVPKIQSESLCFNFQLRKMYVIHPKQDSTTLQIHWLKQRAIAMIMHNLQNSIIKSQYPLPFILCSLD